MLGEIETLNTFRKTSYEMKIQFQILYVWNVLALDTVHIENIALLMHNLSPENVIL